MLGYLSWKYVVFPLLAIVLLLVACRPAAINEEELATAVARTLRATQTSEAEIQEGVEVTMAAIQVAATATPAPTNTPVDTPTNLPTKTPTFVPLVTSTPLPTQDSTNTPTRVPTLPPTHTPAPAPPPTNTPRPVLPTPTPEPTATKTPVSRFIPFDQDGIGSNNGCPKHYRPWGVVELEWAWEGVLLPGEYLEIRLGKKGTTLQSIGVTLTLSSHQMPISWFHGRSGNETYEWQAYHMASDKGTVIAFSDRGCFEIINENP